MSKDKAVNNARKYYTPYIEKVYQLFIETFGCEMRVMDDVLIEAERCRGRDVKESRMVRRIWRRETDWVDEGPYILLQMVSGPGIRDIDYIGPFESDEDSILAYNAIIRLFGFSKSLLIEEPSDEDDFDWGEDEDEDDPWNIDDEDEDDDPWGFDSVEDEDEDEEFDWF